MGKKLPNAAKLNSARPAYACVESLFYCLRFMHVKNQVKSLDTSNYRNSRSPSVALNALLLAQQ